ncbi:rho guanine nucleotide exchange factor 40 isoform X1 [Stigmatopora nigra]
MASEAMEECVQGALSSLYPPFESTAPPLLSQVFTVLESTYQQDGLRYLLDYFVPAKHLLHKLQRHACSQYVGCLFLHCGWPLCLGDKVVVQLSTLDWRLLRCNDFYLQVVPFSTRCPRLALKCLAPGGRTVQEILVLESQHPLVFTSEWLHSVNKERGHRREAGGGLDACLVSTCDGVLRLPWKEIVYPQFIHDPSGEPCPSAHPGGRPSLDSWGWAVEEDEEEDGEEDAAPPAEHSPSRPALPLRRRSEDGLGRTVGHPALHSDYVELLEPRGGPDGGVDPRHRYLEMHGICKTKTLPLCKRGKAIQLHSEKWPGHGQVDHFASFAWTSGLKSASTAPEAHGPPPAALGVTQSGGGRDERAVGGDIPSPPCDVRRPGVGGEGDAQRLARPIREGSEGAGVPDRFPDSGGHPVEGPPVPEEADKARSGDGHVPAEPVESPPAVEERASTAMDSKCRAVAHDGEKKNGERATGKEVKAAAGFRAHRKKRRVRGVKGKARPGTRATRAAPKAQGKAPPHPSSTRPSVAVPEERRSETGSDGQCLSENGVSGTDAGSPAVPGGGPPASVPPSEEAESVGPCKEAPLLRELDAELLASGHLRMTGTVDRWGRALVVMEEANCHSGQEMARVLACYHRMARVVVKDKGLAVLTDCRRSPLCAKRLSALGLFQRMVPGGLGAVLLLVEGEQPPCHLEGTELHLLRGTAVLQQFVDGQQLPTEMGGHFHHRHSDWLSFRQSLESLSEGCESALRLLAEALRSMDGEPPVGSVQEVAAGVDKHRRLMAGVLADCRLTELRRGGGARLAGLANSACGLARSSPDCRAALAAASELYDSVDQALHDLVRVSNRRAGELDALSRLAGLVGHLEKCKQEMEQVQSELDSYKDPPLSLSRLSLQQQKFKALRETANELHGRTVRVLADLETWSESDWAGLNDIQVRLPPVRERLRDLSHCLSDRWTALDNTQRLLSTLTEASQWCDEVSSSDSPPGSSPVCALASLPPIPPSRFQDARSLAVDLGGGALLDLWSRTLERYQRTVARVKPRFLQNQGQAKAKSPGAGSGREAEGEGEWGSGAPGSEGGLQSWGSLASLFRPQTCSTLKIADDRGLKKECAGGGGNFLHNLLKKSPAEGAPPDKPPRKRHPSFDLQALLAPRRGAATPKTGECRTSPKSWLGRRAPTDPVVATGLAAAVRGGGAGAGGGVLIRGVEVSSKEVADHTGSPRQHVLLGRTERETGTERASSTAQSKVHLLWCKMLSGERQYVAVLQGVRETYLPLLELPDTPAPLWGKSESLFPRWAALSAFHSRELLPAMEEALVQSLLQQDCFSKYRDHFLDYADYIRRKPELDAPLVQRAADFFKSKLPAMAASPLSPLCFPQCLQAPPERLEQYCQALEELGGINPSSDSALSVLRHARRHGEDLRAGDLIAGCPIPETERGELVRQGDLTVCGGGTRRKRVGPRRVFLYQHLMIFTKSKSGGVGAGPGRLAYIYKNSMKTADMGLTQSVGQDGLKFEVWVRQTPRLRDCVTLQAPDGEQRQAWTRDVARLLWTHAINSTELCLKESLCVGVSGRLLLDASASQSNTLERVNSSCSDSSSAGSHREEAGGSPAPGGRSSAAGPQASSPSTAV